MERRLLVIALVLLCCSVTAQAATCTLSLPAFVGVYGGGNPSVNDPPYSRTLSIDFGQSFTRIDEVTINCSGLSSPGTNWVGGIPWQSSAGFYADLQELVEVQGPPPYGLPPPAPYQELRLLARAFSCWDSAGAFSETSSFYLQLGAWDSLLDGKIDLLVRYEENYPPPPDFADPWGYGQIDSISISIEGVTAPEPSGIVVLLAGAAGMVGALRRRAGR